jgi:tripartite-type tricarboxylate transporter receptor subunit TctC
VKIRVLYAAALAAGISFGAAAGAAQPSYPTKPVRVIVPYPPGEAADVIARLIGPVMSERMGQQFVVENRAGASGQIGLELLKNAPSDGYTIGVGQGGNLAVAPHTYRKIPYDPIRDFNALALNATNYLALVAHPNVPFKNAKEMVSWAKANPGKLSLATNGEGGFPHLAFELLAQMGGFKFLHVPYKGAAQITTDVMAGQVQLGIGSYTSMSPHVATGRLRLVGVTNPVRVPDKPELPILAEAVPGYDMRGWFGYVAPAGTPREIVQRLNEEINRAMQQPAVAAKLTALGLILANESADYFADFLKSENAKFGKLVKDIGLQAQ